MKNHIKLFGFLAVSALILSACANNEKEEVLDMDNIKVEIQALEDAYAAGEKAKDPDAVAAYYSEDAISYSRNQQPLSKVVDLFAEGNSAVEIGSWTEFDASGTEKQNGNYMSYFQKRDGKYICVRDMSTTTSPVKSGM